MWNRLKLFCNKMKKTHSSSFVPNRSQIFYCLFENYPTKIFMMHQNGLKLQQNRKYTLVKCIWLWNVLSIHFYIQNAPKHLQGLNPLYYAVSIKDRYNCMVFIFIVYFFLSTVKRTKVHNVSRDLFKTVS